MFTVKVFDEKSGEPACNKKVSVCFDGLLRGFSKPQYTDREGEAHFIEDNGNGTIYIQGKVVYQGKIQGRKILYINA